MKPKYPTIGIKSAHNVYTTIDQSIRPVPLINRRPKSNNVIPVETQVSTETSLSMSMPMPMEIENKYVPKKIIKSVNLSMSTTEYDKLVNRVKIKKNQISSMPMPIQSTQILTILPKFTIKYPEKRLLQNSSKNKQINKITDKVRLSFKVAIMIHLFDSKKVTNSLLTHINKMMNRYDSRNIHWYVNIADSINQPQLKAMVESAINYENLTIITNPNKGGDIGGLILLIQEVCRSQIDYGYCYFFHSKTSNIWRQNLLNGLNCLKLESLDEMLDLGLIGSKNHLHYFTYQKNSNYDYHIKNISQVLNVPVNIGDTCYFIGGTIFLVRFEIVKFLGECQLESLYQMLNTTETIDINWQTIVGQQLHKNLKGTNNDYHYRQLYKTSLHSDFMIEHTFERFLGFIVKHLKFNVYGA